MAAGNWLLFIVGIFMAIVGTLITAASFIIDVLG